MQAYRDRAVCVVNSFRSELAHKKAMFGLLTDEALTAKFPAAERKAIREHVPWTRLVSAAKTTFEDKTIDLPEFIAQNRERLALKPNDDSSDLHTYLGWEMDSNEWDRALKQAMRAPYVVQERVEPVRSHLPDAELRPPGVPRDAGGCAPARLPRQGAGMFELALQRPQRLLLGRRHRAHVHCRFESVSAKTPSVPKPSRSQILPDCFDGLFAPAEENRIHPIRDAS